MTKAKHPWADDGIRGCGECDHRKNHHREGGRGKCGLCGCEGFLPRTDGRTREDRPQGYSSITERFVREPE